VPPSKLKTPAGVDHDYNFLSNIERAVQRSEKEIVEERGLLAAADLRPVEVRSVQWRRGKDGTKRRVLVTEVRRNRGASRPELSKQMKKRLSSFGIFIRRVPVGMARQKENGTNVAKSSGRINWQIEWLLVDEKQQAETESGSDDGDENRKPKRVRTTRILGKSLDHLPLYTAFFNSHAAHLKALHSREEESEGHEATEQSGKPKKRKQAPPVPEVQDQTTTTWPLSDYSLQPFPTPSWKRYAGVAAFTGFSQAELAQQTAHHYFLSPNPLSRTSDGKILVHPLDPLAALGEALRDTTVLEFPAIYVISSSASLSEAVFSVSPKSANFRALHASKRKRQDPPILRGHKTPATRHGKKARRELEDGELPSGDEEEVGNAEDGSRDLGSDGEVPSGGYEIVAEESLGEEDGDEDVDDDTSSSGSDFESDSKDDSSVGASLDRKLALLGRKR